MHAKDRPCLVLDCDEDDASTHQRFARLHRKWGRGLQADWAEAEADGFKALAKQFMPRFDLLLAASVGEARRVARYAVEATVVPNVAPECHECRAFQPKGLRRDILFVGNLSYLPNIDAVMWFATRIWPRLQSAVSFPLRFVIAGHGAPRDVVELTKHSGIVLAGGFSDPAPLYRRAALTIVPIRAGGGTRIKLLESAKYGVPIVATRLGAEGSSFRSGQELLLADSEQGFAACCARLLTDFRLASFLAAKAQRTLRRDYDARRCAKRLLDTIEMRLGTGMS
jgi:glycosyltransferase involved in cell wall biosynthesis